jgi:hypothetical protein
MVHPIFSEMKNRKVTPDQLLKQIEKLRDELFVTDVQFQLFVGLRKAAPNYKEEIRATPLFWDYTMRAHIDIVVLRLCRLYDPDSKTISLPNFVLTVEANRDLFSRAAFIERNKSSPNLERALKYNRDLSPKFLEETEQICSPKNPLVKNLLIVRNHFVAHLNHELTFGDAELFQKKFPLHFKDIDKLIKDGFSLLNGVSSVFGGSNFSGLEGSNYPVDDFKFILESLKKRLKKRQGKIFEEE